MRACSSSACATRTSRFRTRYDSIDDVRFPRTDVPFVDLRNVDPGQFRRGAVSPESGRLTGDTLKKMIDWALVGKLDGVSFAPLNKGALHQGGWKFHDEHRCSRS